MKPIPRYFERLQAENIESDLYAFYYDRDDQTFRINDLIVPLAGFDPYEFDPDLYDLKLEKVKIEDIHDHPALLPDAGSVIAGPRLHEWSREHPYSLDEVALVMREAFSSLRNDDLIDAMDESSLGQHGFSVYNRDDGGLSLQVAGDRACLNPELNGLRIEDRFEHGFAEYELLNAFLPEQRASLYAGLGHLASLAAED
jgi:hypothetical protein